MEEQATHADAPDGSANGNTLTHEADDTSHPVQSATYVQGSYSCSYNADYGTAHFRTDANLAPADFPGKTTTGGTSSFTIGAWVRFSALPNTEKTIIGKWDSAAEEQCSYALMTDATNHFVFRVSPNGGYGTGITATAAFTTDTWYLVVGVFDDPNDLIYLYVNGASAASAVAYTSAIFRSTSNFTIGSANGGGERITCLIDESFIFDRVLSSTEVDGIYDHGLAGER